MKTAAIARAPPTTSGIAGEMCNGLELELADVGIETVGTYFVDYVASGTTDAQRANYSRVAETIMNKNPDVVFSCFYAMDPIDEMSRLWRSRSYAPKMAIIGADIVPANVSALEFWIGTDLVCTGVSRPDFAVAPVAQSGKKQKKLTQSPLLCFRSPIASLLRETTIFQIGLSTRAITTSSFQAARSLQALCSLSRPTPAF